MPMRFKNSPIIMQRNMNKILLGIPNVQCYLDDIVIFTKTKSEHINTFNTVLTQLKANGFVINESKI